MPSTKKTPRSKAARWRSYPDTGTAVRGGIRRKRTSRGYRYVSDRKSQSGQTNPWITAVKAARQQLGLEGFHPIKKDGGHCSLCDEFYATSREIYEGRTDQALE